MAVGALHSGHHNWVAALLAVGLDDWLVVASPAALAAVKTDKNTADVLIARGVPATVHALALRAEVSSLGTKSSLDLGLLD